MASPNMLKPNTAREMATPGQNATQGALSAYSSAVPASISPQAVVQKLIHFANDLGGKDNITCLLVRLGTGDVADSHRAKRLHLKREVLASLPLFSRLNERELLRVMQVAEVFEYAPGLALTISIIWFLIAFTTYTMAKKLMMQNHLNY